jgi:hypothetical protein
MITAATSKQGSYGAVGAKEIKRPGELPDL